ncbi:MAG: MarR family transcriptional regulator [Candidatus Thorarchaeota archaeon]|nr:MarR family transcriptional regulator [Candidatus Thorarchaeota archaeon]
MTKETEIVGLFTKILETITFTIEEIEFKDYQMGRGIFIIDFIGRNDSCSLKDIYENTRFPASTASRRVDELVRAGFVKRSRSPEDRREIVLQLTDDGTVVSKLFRDHRIKSMKRFLKSFSSEEVANFVRVLHHLVEHSEEIFII